MPDSAASFPRSLIVYGRQLYFVAVGSIADGYQLFRYSDSTGVTELVVPPNFLPNACTDDDMDHYTEPCIALGALYYPATYDSLETELYKIQASLIGIGEEDAPIKFDVFPDPCTDHLTISLPNKKGPVQLTIFDMEGKKVADRQFAGELAVDVKNFNAGIYMVQVITPSGNAMKKILKE